MDAEALNNIAGAIESFATVAAILVGASWAYWKFILQREAEPATDLDVDVAFVGTQHDKWIIQITATLGNRSLVRLKYEDFQVTVRYLSVGDPVEDGDDRVGYQLRCFTNDRRTYRWREEIFCQRRLHKSEAGVQASIRHVRAGRGDIRLGSMQVLLQAPETGREEQHATNLPRSGGRSAPITPVL